MGLLSVITMAVVDYSLTGVENDRATTAGLASAEWYKTPIDRKLLKQLMKRSDGPALRNVGLWLALLVLTSAGAIALWGTWRCQSCWSTVCCTAPGRTAMARVRPRHGLPQPLDEHCGV